MAEERDKRCDSVHSSIVDIETRLDGKHAVEIKALRNAIKILNLEHKVEMLEKMHDKEIQILKLENENKMLKLKNNDVQEDTTPLKNEKQTESTKASQKGVNEFYIMNTHDLLTKSITKFFGEKLQNSYHEWFEVMAARLTKNTPFIFEKSVLARVACRGYFFQPSRRFTSIQKDDRPSITERNGKWPSGRLLPQLIIVFDLASADFCTGN